MEADAPAEASGQQEEQEVENKTQGQPRSVALFFGNLPWDATSDDVKAAVKEKCGLEVEAKISKKRSGRSRGWGTVRCNAEDLDTLIDLSEKVMISERQIRIERRRSRKRKKKRENADNDAKDGQDSQRDEAENKNNQAEPQPKNNQQSKPGVLLYLNNVPWEVKIDELKQALKEIVPDLECDDVRVSQRRSGISRGYATVRVSKEKAEILKSHSRKMEIGGRQIVIEQKKRPTRRSKRQAKAEAEAAEAADTSGDGTTEPTKAAASDEAQPASPPAEAASATQPAEAAPVAAGSGAQEPTE